MIPEYPPPDPFAEAWERLEATMFEAVIYDLIEVMRNKNA